jgi:hypothetical protein
VGDAIAWPLLAKTQRDVRARRHAQFRSGTATTTDGVAKQTTRRASALARNQLRLVANMEYHEHACLNQPSVFDTPRHIESDIGKTSP